MKKKRGQKNKGTREGVKTMARKKKQEKKAEVIDGRIEMELT